MIQLDADTLEWLRYTTRGSCYCDDDDDDDDYYYHGNKYGNKHDDVDVLVSETL